ncbi:MAG TPA: hypothetical protein VM581_01040 [Magnetospirillaceae bacterium]|nr:hypothetical protein [Magnetospirillaceae bacterium]
MQKGKLLLVGLTLAASLAIAQPALAWHPQIKVVKKVQNVTANSAVADANTNADAVSAKPGDTLKYVVEISNPAQAAQNEWNDLHYTIMTDELPAGVELASNPSQRKITENIGVILPGGKVTKEYLVKVTSKTNGAYINNEACADGDSKVHDTNPKPHDCDNAIVKVHVPEEPKTPETPKTPELPKEIPSTGPEALFVSGFGLGAVTYGAVAFARSKRK